MQEAEEVCTNKSALFFMKGLILKREIGEMVVITTPNSPTEQFIVIWMLKNDKKVARILFNADRSITIDRFENINEEERPKVPEVGGYATSLNPKWTQMILQVAPNAGAQQIVVVYREVNDRFRFRFLASDHVTYYKQYSPDREKAVEKLLAAGRITM